MCDLLLESLNAVNLINLQKGKLRVPCAKLFGKMIQIDFDYV